jgi:hypothetical protein
MANPFRTKSAQELEKESEIKKSIENKIKKTIELAGKCLSSSDFAKYRDSVKESREGLIKLMKANIDSDPLKFAFLAKACLAKIDVFDQLIEEVESDAKKGIINAG